ncbi:surface lipoprotein assembly modifier [Marinobacter sp. TBZ242]|uniref:Surface lipoprotein assembly modifier n=1 Tax=Marinobacter azerbaijanicus TaxID=3050455 RepID=A0ABT7IFH8_9GAMM|nr:surface lipoprotein assembly modifier [Marinobacter sp. TBZ242]MDL0432895.1 surface lipoprotein assembly modifier [Marinobacter sp. TBZ242]
MQSIPRILTLPLALGMAMPWLQLQAEEHARLNGHLEAGFEHDSNVTVDEIDTSSDQSDEAQVFDAGLEGVLKPTEPLNITLGYSLSGRRYQSLDQFDQDIHLLSADISYDFDPVTIGTSYHYSHTTLGADPFLDFRRAGIYLGSLVGENVYLLASVQDKRKDFDDSDARDADIRGASLDSFFFFNQARSYLLLGLDGDREDAEADAYDNDLLRVRVALVHRFTLGGEDNRFRLGWRYEDRDYDQVTVTSSDPLLNDPLAGDLTERSTSRRADRARIVEASWRIGLSDVFSLEPSISWGNYTSNVDSADYDRTVAGITLRAGF